MDSRNRKRSSSFYSHPSSPVPKAPSTAFGIFRDVSNLKTPQNRPKNSVVDASPLLFTASQRTPSAFSRSRFKISAVKSKAARTLKVVEKEQLKSARKLQLEKEKSLKSLSRSLTVWLNFLFDNPSVCGCDPAKINGEVGGADVSVVGRTNGLVVNNGKRGSVPASSVGVEGPWRAPKRHKDSFWRGGKEFSHSMFWELRKSFQEICSLEDLTERMRMHLSLDSCKEIFEAMTLVAKTIDEGRLKMRAGCPIVSDLGMKEKAMKTLMCYNPVWLRIGLYVILGGDSLLPNGDDNCEQEKAFLRAVLEKQFFAHPGLAKAHAYNKLVEGLYRPGYYEKLGNVILKRFLLLVIIMDRAKTQTSLPLKYGIDGLDGGSPLLFSPENTIKSSRDLISEFLTSDVMHGEGNVVSHLVIVGFKVTYQQSPLIEYDFKISDLFKDMQDGIRLCRAVYLLKGDPSIFLKVVDQSGIPKKGIANATLALQYLKLAGVSLSDEDGTEIIPEDVVNGDKELTISLLWNMFVHLQLPLLIDKKIISREISTVQGHVAEDASDKIPLDLLLSWIQAICGTYELNVESYSSLLDGKAMWCLLDYYFRKEHDCSCSCKDSCGTKKEVSIMSAIEYTDAVHNFLLSQKLTSLLGNFPEVLQVSDIIENKGACNWKSVIVLLVFLSVQLLVKRNTDNLNYHKLLGFSCQSSLSSLVRTDSNTEEVCSRDFRTIMSWWQDMAQQNGKGTKVGFTWQELMKGRKITCSSITRENAAIIIQSHQRRIADRRNYLMVRNAALILQKYAYAWLVMQKKLTVQELKARKARDIARITSHAAFLADRQYFVNTKSSVIVIQQAIRSWIAQRSSKINAATVIQRYARGWLTRFVCTNMKVALQMASAIKIQKAWKDFLVCKSIQRQKNNAAVKIQSHYLGLLIRKSFERKKLAAITIQTSYRYFRRKRNFRIHKEENAATTIQSHCRGWLVRSAYANMKRALQTESAIKIQKAWNTFLIRREMQNAAVKIQSHFLGWLIRRSYTGKKMAIRTIQISYRYSRSKRSTRIQKEKEIAAKVIQSHFRGWVCRREAHRKKNLIITLQGFCRGCLQREKLLLQKYAATKIKSSFRRMSCRTAFMSLRLEAVAIQAFIRGENSRRKLTASSCSNEGPNNDPEQVDYKNMMHSVVKIQGWWRYVLRMKTKNAAVLIQLHFRGWMAKQLYKRKVQSAILIQSCWKGYLARKHTKTQLLDLRLRMAKSAANVNESRRLINRLIAALSELLNMKSVTNILHTCATLDMATELSQKCCEELVSAGAICTLLTLIQSMSRSIPDQQVLKHAVSTLRNLASYPHLAEILVQSPYCMETIVLEFLRNKEDAYFITADLLKKMCLTPVGVNAIRKSPALLKRLNNLTEELARKAAKDKRTPRALRENADKRLKEVVELLGLVSHA